ncbi:NADH dehydrogenase [ubiquinone] 1 alpha subcomplex assembly factor 2 [Callorhinchus milii]|uniref:Mitochondrial mimitin n=1 Tax=Callorhinchus milii TaxID=7868 RepID=K4GLG2_CALMI|nr:NADH dehydrogenase [ubiquinone] 1 alpha subcomplex assembly factor 2 [Callorhinchus milii]AFM90552.1 mitochondrial mimitin [Callorhinchus milii]|eukprot:gi/632949753/ref/XP_007890337.1/ PREDICTED: mimitin, mitochondrial [Callorhinchus milii]
MDRLRALLGRSFGLVKQLVGTDHLGNKYYCIPRQEGWAGQSVREKRMVEPAHSEEVEFGIENIPTEWEAWVRGRRKEPPTMEEILANEEYRRVIKMRAQEVEEKERRAQEKGYEEGLVAKSVKTQVKGHASATYYAKDEPSSEPSSTANTFQPGSWTPSESSSKKQ